MNFSAKTFRLPIWSILVLLVAGLVSAMFSPGPVTFLSLVLLVVNLGAGYLLFRSEVNRLKDSHVGHGPVDKAKLRSDAKETVPVPRWYAITLGVGAFWSVIVVIKLVGFLFGLLLVLAILAAVGFGGWKAYQSAKARGLI